MQNFSLQVRNGVWYGVFHPMAQAGVVHAVSTRLGGVSQVPYASLNLAFHTGDRPEAVIENRRRFCTALNLPFEKLVTAKQVHGDRIKVVRPEDAGVGNCSYADALDNTDALVTNIPGIPLILFYADCVPVLLFDARRKAVGVCHAGWKGSVARIVMKTLDVMRDAYGTDPGDCLAGIGPSIGPCCYEVDQTVIHRLSSEFPNWQAFVTPGKEEGRWLLDLWELNRWQLQESGLSAQNITVSGVCTEDNVPLFFSYRGENGCTGRIGAIISLPPAEF